MAKLEKLLKESVVNTYFIPSPLPLCLSKLKKNIIALQNLAVQASSPLVKIALNANIIVHATMDAEITFFTLVQLAHNVKIRVRLLFLISILMDSMDKCQRLCRLHS